MVVNKTDEAPTPCSLALREHLPVPSIALNKYLFDPYSSTQSTIPTIGILASILQVRKLELRKIDLHKVAWLVNGETRVRIHVSLPTNDQLHCPQSVIWNMKFLHKEKISSQDLLENFVSGDC